MVWTRMVVMVRGCEMWSDSEYIYTLSIDNGVLDGLDVEMRKREFEDGLSILF